MKTVNLVGQFYGTLGIPQHTREFARGLRNTGNEVNGIQLSSAPGNDKLIEREFLRPLTSNELGLVFWYPNVYPEYSLFQKTIGYFIFEYTVIPPYYVSCINELDGVCTASKWGADVLKANGVKVPIYVIPGGVRSATFSPAISVPLEPFRFLHVGKCEQRKSTDLIIRAFNIVSRGSKDIRLTLSIDNPNFQGFSARQFIDNLSNSMEFPTDNLDIIHHVDDIAALYQKHNCAVFASKAEGIGLPIVEAMSCGLPTITSYNSGITEYANDSNAILLKDLKEEPIYDRNYFPNSGEFGTWNTPSLDELVYKMNWVLANYSDALKIGAKAAEDMHTKYTWEISAQKFISEVS